MKETRKNPASHKRISGKSACHHCLTVANRWTQKLFCLFLCTTAGLLLLSLCAEQVGAAPVTGTNKQTAPAGVHNAKKAKHHRLTESDALSIVAKRPEVKAWQQRISTDPHAKSRGCSAHVEMDRQENGAFIVHVYEDVPDGDGSSHSATFNWYHVNIATGKVSTEF